MARPLTSQTWLCKYATGYHARTLCGLILMKANLASSHTDQLRWIEFDIGIRYITRWVLFIYIWFVS